eukprot:scaffold4.g5016.t1
MQQSQSLGDAKPQALGGEAILSVPLRLAVTDDAGEEEGGAPPPGGQQQPWSVRLAARLLALRAAGGACPWAPYLCSLPAAVPSPLAGWTWEDIQAVEYPHTLRDLDHASWLASSALHALGGGRGGGGSGGSGEGGGAQKGGGAHGDSGARGSDAPTREEVDWALSIVHSRSFGAPGKQGAVAVRMLVPLVDMLNHAGDVTVSDPGAPEPEARAFDNVRWDLDSPSAPAQAGGGGGGEGEWAMVVSATRDIGAGEELFLSYGERSNDDFLAHYGFVPPRNPHDTGVLDPRALQAAISAAYAAAEQQQAASGAAEAALAAMPEAEADVARAELARIRLSGGGRVDGRLLAAMRALQGACVAAVEALQARGSKAAREEGGVDWREHARDAVRRRAREVLATMPTPLADNLAALARWEAASGGAQHGWGAALRHYGPLLAACEGKSMGRTGGGDVDAAGPAAFVGQLVDAGAAAQTDAALLASLRLAQAAAGDGAGGGAEGAAAEQGQQATGGGDGGGRSMLPVMYRAYKKLILWDAVLLE